MAFHGYPTSTPRRANPIITGPEILLGLLVFGAGLVLLSDAKAASSKIQGVPLEPDPTPLSPSDKFVTDETNAEGRSDDVFECAPLRYDRKLIRAQIDSYLNEGSRSPSLIALNTAAKFYRHWDFPPAVNAPPFVWCVYNKIQRDVALVFAERGLVFDEDRPVPAVWKTVSVAPGSPDLARYPWDEAVLEEHGFPTPSTFTLVNPGDTDYSYIRNLTGRILAMAGVDTAPAFDNSKLGRRLRSEVRNLLICANDRLYTSTSCALAGGKGPTADDPGTCYMMGPNKRGLVWLPWHADNLGRIGRGQKQKRNVSQSGSTLGSGSSHMLLWNPAVNLELVRGANPEITTRGVSWKDGRNTIDYPSPVWKLGVDLSGVVLDGGAGCQPPEGPWE